MTLAEIVAAMLAVVPARTTPVQLAGLKDWEREGICRRARCPGPCSPEAWNELLLAVYARGTYRKIDANNSRIDRSEAPT